MRQVIPTRSNAEGVISNSAVRYMPFCTQTAFFATTEDIAQAPWATAGTFSNLVIKLGTAPGGAASRTYVVRKNGVDTALSVVITGSETTGRDVTNSVTVAPGDLLSMSTTPAGSPSSSGLTEQTFIVAEFVSTNARESGYGWAPAALSTTTTRWNGLFSGWTWNATSGTTTHNVVAAAGDITALLLATEGGATQRRCERLQLDGISPTGHHSVRESAWNHAPPGQDGGGAARGCLSFRPDRVSIRGWRLCNGAAAVGQTRHCRLTNLTYR